MRHGEAAGSKKVAADNFTAQFQEYLGARGFAPQQVLNYDDTSLF